MSNVSENIAIGIKEQLLENDRKFKETGCYAGITELKSREQDPLRYESLHTKLRSMTIASREMARSISASPGVREVGEMVVALYTPEGDAISLSTGIMVHVHTMSRFIKWMIQNGYEDSPGICPGDVFANNDAFIGTVQVPDVMVVIPIFHNDELVGWAGTVAHELEVGGITPGGDVYLAQERFTEGLFVCAEKVGEKDELRRDYLIRLERNLRMPIYWMFDDKAKLAANLELREQVKQLIDEVGLDYYKRATREFIEEGRRAQLSKVQQLMVPGRYRGHTFYGHLTEGKPGILPLGDENLLYSIPLELDVGSDGQMHLDFEGTGSWGYHSMNCTPAGMDGGLFVTLTQSMNFEGKVNDGAWLATDMNLPSGTWTNPDRHTVATATSWALLLPAFGIFQRLLSRGFVSRGFKEEAFVGQVNSPMVEMGGQSQYGSQFGMAMFECSAAGSGALGIKDGIDNGYVGWNPESDMGNMEVWEQGIPMLYLGRSIATDSGGAGRNRGGTAFTSLWLVHNTDEVTIATSEHSSRVFDNAGMCGGYPAPTAHRHFTVRDSNIQERIKEQKPLPHSLGKDPYTTDLERLVEGEKKEIEGPHIDKPLQSGDLFAHSYNGGGGYGDPIERDPLDVVRDVENGYVTPEIAQRTHAVVLEYDEERNAWRVNSEATEARRTETRNARLKKAMPVKNWIASERERVLEKDFVTEVYKMYQDTMGISSQFAKEFREFWQLPENFTM
ncbi:N-methylhydantoinase B/oxoprolinase/acetone carboxylase, alpha subunit [Lentibacillus persicus]|uniref:N-methylhydantoinase B/oxoprolinase/acetone carboxylase, alpha subunit n=1 Tax=Lentibacillus persicus TaxID=640948 RepID=A0A1I1YYZ4_9BACI|nr:hydantoinase B/oxoprolinase family protein [Lentibacillus persicus]SFE24198.1 N-methylhydantoinase B/oxoprolinase/acetone carboxylase, alpha subunit [Lentibacillus persicus]